MVFRSKLRNSDKLLLSNLEKNSRIPFSRLGKNIKKSQQQVSYTVNSLVQKDVIKNFYTIIDYSKLDVLNFRVYFRVSYVDEEKFNELIEHLKNLPYTSWIVDCGGRYDLICTFFTQNPSQFNKNLKNVIEKFPKQIQNYTVLTTIVNRILGRKYLFKDFSRMSRPIVGGDREPEKIDEIDLKILGELAEDARRSSVMISRKLEMTPKTVINRIKNLETRKIIRGYKPLLNTREIGYESNLLLIKYHNISSEKEDELINYLKMHPNVVSVVKTLGEWDIEIEVEVEEQIELRKVERKIRQKFALLIKEIESIPMYQPHKICYFPSFLLD